MFCRIFEYPAKFTSSELFNAQDPLNSIVNERVFISSKIMKKTVSCENNLFMRNSQPVSTTWRRGKHGDMAFFLMMVLGGFLFTYFIRISWNQIKCNEICIKLCFMKQSERYISQCILAFIKFIFLPLC